MYPEQATLKLNLTDEKDRIMCYETLEINILVTVGTAPVGGVNLTITTTLGIVAPDSTKNNAACVLMTPVMYSPAIVDGRCACKCNNNSSC